MGKLAEKPGQNRQNRDEKWRQTLPIAAGVPNPLAARDVIDKRFSMRKNETI
ncbi:MAG: hypothetical protein ACLQVF_45115 [Isosphaeraceae bacterium]